MGFRNYLGKIEKEKYNKIKGFDIIEKLYDYFRVDYEDIEDAYLSMRDVGIEQIYGMGKYVQMDIPEGLLYPFFENEELNDYFNSDNDLFLATRNFLKLVIEDYEKKNMSYLKKLLDPFHEDTEFLDSMKIKKYNVTENDIQYDFSKLTQNQINALHEMIGDIRFKITDVSYGTYNLDTDTDNIVRSSRYEYTIFELVRLYKTFDWDNYYLVYYGW